MPWKLPRPDCLDLIHKPSHESSLRQTHPIAEMVKITGPSATMSAAFKPPNGVQVLHEKEWLVLGSSYLNESIRGPFRQILLLPVINFSLPSKSNMRLLSAATSLGMFR
jgi:hypothetical protein